MCRINQIEVHTRLLLVYIVRGNTLKLRRRNMQQNIIPMEMSIFFLWQPDETIEYYLSCVVFFFFFLLAVVLRAAGCQYISSTPTAAVYVCVLCSVVWSNIHTHINKGTKECVQCTQSSSDVYYCCKFTVRISILPNNCHEIVKYSRETLYYAPKYVR